MKRVKLAIMLAAIGMMVPQLASAYDFEKNGIYYNESGKNATVTYKTEAYNSLSLKIMLL